LIFEQIYPARGKKNWIRLYLDTGNSVCNHVAGLLGVSARTLYRNNEKLGENEAFPSETHFK
jgi:hypothetical protein